MNLIKHIFCGVLSIIIASYPVLLWAELPVLGDPSRQDVSPMQEYAMGLNYFQTLQANHLLLDDALINEYIHSLGQKLVSNSENPDLRAKFFIVNSTAINAFALPGGFIGTNSGLILEASNERELAGVLAHEISHVTQRHIARGMSANSNSSATMFAALLAALIIGAQNPNAAAAIFYGGAAANMQSQINFTRHNEYEADRIGVSVLRKAGINPTGMADFFETLLAKAESDNAMAQMEFLRTHPLSSTRIAETRHRLEASDQQLRSDSLDFQLSKARILAQSTDRPQALIKKLSRLYKEKQELPIGYALALIQLDSRQASKAEKLIQSLLQQRQHPWFQLALARAYRLQKQDNKALQLLSKLSKLYPNYLPVSLAYAKLLINHKDYSKAIQLLKYQIQSQPNSNAYKTLAQAYYSNGQIVSALESTSYQYEIDGYIRYAAQQIDNALKQPQMKNSTRLRLESRKTYLTSLFSQHSD